MDPVVRGGWKNGEFANANECFISPGTALDGVPVSEFWRWAYSSLLTDTVRGIVAEFIVAQLVGGNTTPQTPWERWDVTMNGDIRIEVKSSAYVNTWNREKVAKSIGFSGLKATIFPPTEPGDDRKTYHAHVFVFCLLATQNWNNADPLDVDQWEFYVLPANRFKPLKEPNAVSLYWVRKNADKCTAAELEGSVRNAYSEAIANGFQAPRKDRAVS